MVTTTMGMAYGIMLSNEEFVNFCKRLNLGFYGFDKTSEQLVQELGADYDEDMESVWTMFDMLDEALDAHNPAYRTFFNSLKFKTASKDYESPKILLVARSTINETNGYDCVGELFQSMTLVLNEIVPSTDESNALTEAIQEFDFADIPKMYAYYELTV